MRRQATLTDFPCLLYSAHAQTCHSDWLYLFTQLCACADRLLWLAFLVYCSVRMRRQATLIGFTCLLFCAHAQTGTLISFPCLLCACAGRQLWLDFPGWQKWNCSTRLEPGTVSLTQHLEPVSLQLVSRRAGTASSWCGSERFLVFFHIQVYCVFSNFWIGWNRMKSHYPVPGSSDKKGRRRPEEGHLLVT
jgi:hypothetical protein